MSPRQHLRVQQAFQQYVDNAVSKTINLPEASSHEDVAQAYVQAWRLGLKGHLLRASPGNRLRRA